MALWSERREAHGGHGDTAVSRLRRRRPEQWWRRQGISRRNGRSMCLGGLRWARRAAGTRREGRAYDAVRVSERRSKRHALAPGSTDTPVRAGKGTLVGESVWPMRSSRRTKRRLQSRGGAEIGARGHDAEHACQSRHSHPVCGTRRLAGVADDVEDLCLGQAEDRKPVEP